MRKKWTYVAIVSMMLGVAPVFTGCVDTDEPAGITELRGAKAELLRAKAAVQQANAQYRLAEIEFLNAQTAQQAAIATWYEYQAEYQRLVNEAKEAQNAAEKAEYDAQIQYYQNLMEEEMLKHETAMINLENLKAQAQRNYELILKQIEIAEAIGSDQDLVTLQNLKDEIKNAYFALYGDGTGTSGLSKELRDAQENLYNAQMNKLAGYDSDADNTTGLTPDIWIPSLENEVAKATAERDAQQKIVDALVAFKEAPVADTDWRAEVDQIETRIDSLEKAHDEVSLKITEGKTSSDYLEKDQAVNGVLDASGNVVPGGEGTKHILNNANVALLNKQKSTPLSIADYEPETEITSEMMKAINAQYSNPSDYKSESWFSYSNIPDYTWADATATNPNFADQYPQVIKDFIKDHYTDQLEAIDKATPKTANEIAQAQASLAQAKKDEETAKTKYETEVKNWQSVLDIVQNAKTVTVPTTTDTKFGKAVKEYNDAYTALNTAITNWNTKVADAYQTAYNTELEKQTAAVRANVLKLMDTDGSNNPSGDTYGTVAVAGFDADNALKLWEAYGVTGQQTEAMFTTLVNNNCGTASSTAEEKAKIQEAVWTQINNYVNLTTSNANWGGKDSAVTAGKTAAAKADADGKLQKAIDDAITAVTGKYNALDQAISDFNTLANNTYAQKLTDAAAKLLKKDMLAGVVKDGKATVGAWATSSTTAGYTTYTIGNTNITDEEVADATDTAFDATFGQTALETASDAAFGRDANNYPWYVQPSREEWEASPNSNASSAAGVYYAAVVARENQEAVISANEDLQKLGAEIEAAQAAFEAQLAADYAEAFKDEQAAWDEAKAADDAARKALAEADAQFADLYLEQNEIQAEINAQNYLATTLKQLIWDNLGIEWPAGTAGGTATTYEPEKFEEQLDGAIYKAKDDLADKEQLLAKAEVELQKAQEGAYDEVNYAEYKLAIVQARYEQALEAYEQAQANLEKALEIMAASSDAEQPAE